MESYAGHSHPGSGSALSLARCWRFAACYARPPRSLFTALQPLFNYHLDHNARRHDGADFYNYAISPYDEWHAQAWAATLVLMTLILGIIHSPISNAEEVLIPK